MSLAAVFAQEVHLPSHVRRYAAAGNCSTVPARQAYTCCFCLSVHGQAVHSLLLKYMGPGLGACGGQLPPSHGACMRTIRQHGTHGGSLGVTHPKHASQGCTPASKPDPNKSAPAHSQVVQQAAAAHTQATNGSSPEQYTLSHGRCRMAGAAQQ
jgi:hypothetical protein